MRKRIFFSTLVLITLACALPFSPAPSQVALPTMPAGALETIIVQTAGAAQTMTSVALPTFTPTATDTVTPSITPTPTVTFIYKLYTDTPIPSETPTISFTVEGGGSSGEGGEDAGPDKSVFTGKEWTCGQVGVFPPKNTEYKVKSRFTVYWTLMNTGTKTWPLTGVDFVYSGGYRHEGTKIQDFGLTIPPGGKITVSATFVAPKRPGEFQTIFHLMVGKRDFCGVNYPFIIIP